jgi:D-sedoheptulose 7-phosphate isomerase
MEQLNYIKEYLNNSLLIKQKLLNDDQIIKLIASAADAIKIAYGKGNKVMLAGNGGSAADSQHIAAELVSRFFYDRPGLSAMALTTDTSIITAIGNDYGFDKLFERQVEAYGVSGDIFIGISTSGNSENILKAVHAAKKKGIYTICFSGKTGDLKKYVDIPICVPSDVTPFIQECHITIGHLICAMVEKEIFVEN